MAENPVGRSEPGPAGPSGSNTDVLPPRWQRAPARPARAPRRREPISHRTIVAGAIELLDRDGLDALSMRRLADELGIGAASLYWHVGSKDGLLDLVLDEVIGEIKIPDPDPDHWREQLKDYARAKRAVSLRHPWLVRVSVARFLMGPNAMRYSEHVLAILRAGGLPSHLAVQGYGLLVSSVNGFTIEETGIDDSPNPTDLPRDADSRQQAGESARDYIAALPPSQYPLLTEMAGEWAETDLDDRFELLLDIFVDGLSRHAKP
jgi:AcrR family transcriptional regulator